MAVKFKLDSECDGKVVRVGLAREHGLVVLKATVKPTQPIEHGYSIATLREDGLEMHPCVGTELGIALDRTGRVFTF